MVRRGKRVRLIAGLAAVLLASGVTAALAADLGATAVTYEAESAVCQGTVDSDHAGYSGTGFCNTTNAVGSHVEWTVNVAAAGSYTLRFRHANGSTANRPMDIAVNGAVSTAGVAFAPTGGWSSWATVTVTATLSAGANTIRATATTVNGGPNVDYLEVAA